MILVLKRYFAIQTQSLFRYIFRFNHNEKWLWDTFCVIALQSYTYPPKTVSKLFTAQFILEFPYSSDNIKVLEILSHELRQHIYTPTFCCEGDNTSMPWQLDTKLDIQVYNAETAIQDGDANDKRLSSHEKVRHYKRHIQFGPIKFIHDWARHFVRKQWSWGEFIL